MDLIDDCHRQNLADAWNGTQQMKRILVMNLGFPCQIKLEVRDDFIVVTDEFEVDLDALGCAGICELCFASGEMRLSISDRFPSLPGWPSIVSVTGRIGLCWGATRAPSDRNTVGSITVFTLPWEGRFLRMRSFSQAAKRHWRFSPQEFFLAPDSRQ